MIKRKYTLEFKQEAVKLVTEQGYSQAKAAKSLGVRHQNLSRWMTEFKGENGIVREKKIISSDQEELIQLRKENNRLKLEREILKKAAAFFANEPA